MLVLVRQPSENVMIGDDVIVALMEVERNRVRIGIKAPKDVAVHREEVYEAIQREQGRR